MININKCNFNFSDITNINAYSGSFDFLKDEPDLYSVSDVKKKYACGKLIKKIVLGEIGRLSESEILQVKAKIK